MHQSTLTSAQTHFKVFNLEAASPGSSAVELLDEEISPLAHP